MRLSKGKERVIGFPPRGKVGVKYKQKIKLSLQHFPTELMISWKLKWEHSEKGQHISNLVISLCGVYSLWVTAYAKLWPVTGHGLVVWQILVKKPHHIWVHVMRKCYPLTAWMRHSISQRHFVDRRPFTWPWPTSFMPGERTVKNPRFLKFV